MDELKAKYQVTVIIIAVQIAMILALTTLAWFSVYKFETTPTASTVTTLWIAVIFLAVASFLLRRVFFNWEKLTNTFLLKGKTGLINQLRVNTLILISFAVAIAVIGFVITALTGDEFQMLRAAAIALIVCLINFPRRTVWEKIAANLEKLDQR